MARFANEVRVQLVQTADPSSDTEIVVQVDQPEPNSLPVDPGGVAAPLTLMDGWYGWTKAERITYTGVTDNQDGTYTLTGIAWAQEGTSSPPGGWTVGDYVIQDVPASWFNQVESDLANKSDIGHGHDWADISDPPVEATRWPAWPEVSSKPSLFPPEAHGHTLADISDSGALAALDAVSVAEMDSGAEVSGRIMKADGAGGVIWGDDAGGVGNHDLDFHDDVTNDLAVDGFLFWDQSSGGWIGLDEIPKELIPDTLDFNLRLDGSNLEIGYASGSEKGIFFYSDTNQRWGLKAADTGFTLTYFPDFGPGVVISRFYHDEVSWFTDHDFGGNNISGAGSIIATGLGVGVSSPSYLVDAAGTGNEDIRISSTGADSLVGIRMENDARQWRAYVAGTQSDDFVIRDINGAINALTLAAGTGNAAFVGNVGIGTTTPNAKLVVNNVGSIDPILSLKKNNTTEVFTVLNDGNVGIGTNSPSANLDVEGLQPAIELSDTGSGAQWRFIVDDPSGALRFWNSAQNDVIWINNGGNVGIGTNSPDELLTVNGRARFLGTAECRGDQTQAKFNWRNISGGNTWIALALDNGDWYVTGSGSGTIELYVSYGGGVAFRDSANSTAFEMNAAGELFAYNLPLGDPGVSGQLYIDPVDSATIKVSA